LAYSTQADIVKKLPLRFLRELTDDENGLIVDTDVVTEAIADADSQIDSFARGKHTIPFSPVPNQVKRWSVNLAILYFYARRTDYMIPDPTKLLIDFTMTELRGLRDGKILIDDTTSVANTASFYKLRSKQNQPIFQTTTSKNGRLDRFYAPNDGLDNS